MPKDVTLLLLAQDHTDTDWSKQVSTSIPELHKSLKNGKKLVLCTEQGAHASAEGMMTYNAQMVAEIRVSQAAKLASEKALAPNEFQKRVEAYMRDPLKVEPEKSFKPYLPANDLDTFLKTANKNLPLTFHGREDAYLAELELFRYAQANKIPSSESTPAGVCSPNPEFPSRTRTLSPSNTRASRPCRKMPCTRWERCRMPMAASW
jgi:hypothetical protein